ncbi:MAG TPA: transposase, partial [Ktedonobacteraceae bacterium]|nr:transposase [Ktedonobacteraceae bacterium]
LHATVGVYDRQGKCLDVERIAPKQVGQAKEVAILLGRKERLPMRLLLVRVPEAVAAERREDIKREAKQRRTPVSEKALRLASWTLLFTDVPRAELSIEEALILMRERWQMELLYKLWKQEGEVDEWVTDNPWRIMCELYAKLIGLLLQHWMIVLFTWHDPQRSLVKCAQVMRETGWTIMEALAGRRSLRSALYTIRDRMRSGCRMNTRHTHPNSAQLLADGLDWALELIA